MSDPTTDHAVDNLDPRHFVFWQPAAGDVTHVGADQQPVPLPPVPLPIKISQRGEGAPSDNAIGEGVYDYLRQFPDCQHNIDYALLLRQAYSHFLADLAAHAVMLDAKDVEPAYVFRKLTYLKILRLLEPDNRGLLWQLAQGFYDLAMTFTELLQVRRFLLEAMRFGQDLLKLNQDDQAVLNLLAEIDLLFGDYPAAVNKLRRMLKTVSDPGLATHVEARIASCLDVGCPDHPLVDDLEQIAEAMQLYAARQYHVATEMLECLAENEYFQKELLSADFLCLLGMCRNKSGDQGGAFDALSLALEINPDHEQARQVLESI